MMQDIGKAYFFAPATRNIFIELPPEDAAPGMVGMLEKSLYGTRDAAMNWAAAYTSVMLDMGFRKGKSSPCSFVHKEWDICTVVHGDDFLSVGPAENLKKMDTAMRAKFKVKTEVIGPDSEQVRQARFLNRVITWEDAGITWEPDPRHAEIILKQLGLEGGKSLKVPGVKEESRRSKKELEDDVADEVNAVLSECAGNGEFDRVRRELADGSRGVGWDTEFMQFRRECLVRAAHARENGGLPTTNKSIDEINNVEGANDEHMLAAGMTDNCWLWQNGRWTMEIDEAISLPRVPCGVLVSREVYDIDTGKLIDSVKVTPTTKPSQLNKKFKVAKNIRVEMDVVAEGSITIPWEDQPMEATRATQYRALAARLNFMAVDRPDMLYTAKECSRHMSKPWNRNWEPIKRAARYLLHVPRLVHFYKWQEEPRYLSAYSDSDWAGCRETRKSTSGACFMHGAHLIKSYSRTQANIALSSGEAEYYSMVKAASESWGFKSNDR